jgi:diaminopimelate decarboxylase
MSGFERGPDGVAKMNGVPLAEILPQVSTPAYVYDLDGIADQARALAQSLGPDNLVAYAVKANSAGTIVRTIAAQGCGADVVSAGELELALVCGVAPRNIVMSGVAKGNDELDIAITRGIRAIQVESVEEIARVAARGTALSRSADIAIRINPSVRIDSHAHIATGHDAAKFGVQRADLPAAIGQIQQYPGLSLVGVSAHVGSMLDKPDPYVASASVVCDVALDFLNQGFALTYVDFGGGFGIDYGGKPAQRPEEFAKAAIELKRKRGLEKLALLVEPGRSLVGPFGVLVTRVVQQKVSGPLRWLMIDAGMNDLIRPALYGARHRIEPLDRPPADVEWRVVGPVCESSDDFGLHPLLADAPELLAIRDAGAYGFTLASEYNGRPLPSEVFLKDGKIESVSPGSGRAAWVRRRASA